MPKWFQPYSVCTFFFKHFFFQSRSLSHQFCSRIHVQEFPARSFLEWLSVSCRCWSLFLMLFPPGSSFMDTLFYYININKADQTDVYFMCLISNNLGMDTLRSISQDIHSNDCVPNMFIIISYRVVTIVMRQICWVRLIYCPPSQRSWGRGVLELPFVCPSVRTAWITAKILVRMVRYRITSLTFWLLYYGPYHSFTNATIFETGDT